MNIPRLYVESTMFNFYFYGKGKEKQTYTLRLFNAIAAGTYEAYTSEYAIKELSYCQVEDHHRHRAGEPATWTTHRGALYPEGDFGL
jgi:hypothetical protein